MQWNVNEQAKTHAQRPGEYLPPFNRLFSFVLPCLSHGRTAQLADSIEIQYRWRWLKNFQTFLPLTPRSSSTFLLQKSSKYPPPFPRLRRFPTNRGYHPSISSTPLGPSLTNFIKFHPWCTFHEDARRWKLARFEPRARGPNRNLSRGVDIRVARTINPGLRFSPLENGVTGCGCSGRPIQSTYPRGTYDRNFIKRGEEGRGEKKDNSHDFPLLPLLVPFNHIPNRIVEGFFFFFFLSSLGLLFGPAEFSPHSLSPSRKGSSIRFQPVIEP